MPNMPIMPGDSTPALVSLFFALLEYHEAEEIDGYGYRLPADFPPEDFERLKSHAQRIKCRPNVLAAALKDLLLVKEKLTTEEVNLLLNGRYPPPPDRLVR